MTKAETISAAAEKYNTLVASGATYQDEQAAMNIPLALADANMKLSCEPTSANSRIYISGKIGRLEIRPTGEFRSARLTPAKVANERAAIAEAQAVARAHDRAFNQD